MVVCVCVIEFETIKYNANHHSDSAKINASIKLKIDNNIHAYKMCVYRK